MDHSPPPPAPLQHAPSSHTSPQHAPPPLKPLRVAASTDWPLRALFALVLLFAIQQTRTVLLPVVLAVVLTLMLAPFVQRLKRAGVPETVSAVLVVFATLSVIVVVFSAVIGPAINWWERAPSNMQQLNETIDRVRRAVPLLAPPEAPPPATPAVRNPRVALPTVPAPTPTIDPIKERLTSEGITFTRAVLFRAGEVAVAAAATVMLLFFLLASESWLVARTVQLIPRWRERALFLSGVRAAQREMSYFFVTQTLINCGVGLAVGLSSWWLGLPNPVLWGVATAVLNFIPYLGPVAAGTMLLLAGILTFNSLGDIIAPTIALIVIHAVESNIVSPLVMGKRLELSPLAVFLSVLLWGWLWGIPGALIAVPMLLVLRIACQRVRPWRLWASYLDRRRAPPSLRALLRPPRIVRPVLRNVVHTSSDPRRSQG